MRLLPCGDRAILVDLADRDERRRFETALAARPIPLLTEQVPADHTVLLRVAHERDLATVADRVRSLDLTAAPPRDAEGPTVTLPVRYDGPDLDVVAAQLDLTTDEVIARHSAQAWRVEFGGFAPGFAYLSATETAMTVPRRTSARTRIPAGSVGLAGDYSGVYPSASPGGWQLIGSTDAVLWEATRTPPALLAPGTLVRFEAIR